jgi:hypothetical protein
MKSTPGTFLRVGLMAVALLLSKASYAQDNSDTTATQGSTGTVSLPDPANYQREIIYDPISGNYLVYKRYGDVLFLTPEVWTTDQYRQYMYDQQMQDYFGSKSALYNASGDNPRDNAGLVPQIQTGNEALGQVFGSDVVEIRPQGMAEIRFGGKYQYVQNPGIPVRNQKTFAFDFGQRIQMNVKGKIGDRLELGVNYDTEATFAFDNKMKLDFEGEEDDIIKRLEMGNINMPLNSSLITGAQSLFGLKGQFQFGNTMVTTVFSEQRSQSQSVNVQGGGTTQEFYIQGDEYEANRHYFLSQFFRAHYEEYLENLPLITSPIQITKVEVWITNERSATQNLRNIVAFMDLGADEDFAFRNDTAGLAGMSIFPGGNVNIEGYPNNANNKLDPLVLEVDIPGVRDIATANQVLSSAGLIEAKEYVELANARKLEPNQYKIHPQLGYITLNQALNQDEVLAVAFQYTAAGRTYQVGEFSNDGVTPPKTLILKLLKSTVLDVRMPTWDLMMKNIYALNAYQLDREDFYMDILYMNDETGVPIPFLPDGNLSDTLLIGVMELDRLNTNNDPFPDGIFDFVPGTTIDQQRGRIIFPVVEPFGSNLYKKLDTEKARNRYVYQALYDSTRFRAQEQTQLNKFILRGQYKSASGSEISLGAFNIPQGSVTVTAGGRTLTENQDYTVDYSLGRVRIINEGVLNSGAPIKVNFENNTLFNVQTKSFYGTAIEHKVNKHLNVGGTWLRLTERPLTQKVNIGDEPISNTIWGMNMNYSNDAPYLTRWVDALPFIETKEKSQVQFKGEFAHLIPGSPRGIKITGAETTYLDDFESSQTTIDLRSLTAWNLASTPSKQSQLFPESSLNNDLAYGFNRAKLAWYIIDPSLYTGGASVPDNIRNDPEITSDQRMREVLVKEVFPNYSLSTNEARNLAMFDLAYYPAQRGPYNYDVEGLAGISQGIDANGNLVDPASRWAGIMRPLQINNFEEQNIEFIQFWVMDPFYDNDNAPDGGDLYFNLGSVSEDILKDGRQSFENGIPADGDKSTMDSTKWGLLSEIQPITEFFDNASGARGFQDVGFDALNDSEERLWTPTGGTSYLQRISNTFGQSNGAYQKAFRDPSADNFVYYRGDSLDNASADILRRYYSFNGVEGNSSTATINGAPASATNVPDKEDANRDQTLSKTESYFQYRVSMREQDLVVGKNYVADIYETNSHALPNGMTRPTRWIQFKIPVFQPEKKVGGISDFRSIRFMRMFLTDFKDPIVLRFAKLELVRGEWRRFPFTLDDIRENVPVDESDGTTFNVNAVNLEENGGRVPIPYVLPPDIERQKIYGGTQIIQQNEQSMSLEICGLKDGDARAVFRNFNFDMRMYKRLKMFVHAESSGDFDDLKDGDLSIFVRLGSDYNGNYYEYEVPLSVSSWGSLLPDEIWPIANNVDLNFEDLKTLKLSRNAAMESDPTLSLLNKYSITTPEGNKISVVGAPNLSNVRTLIIGIRNPKKRTATDSDDGLSKCAEIWVNELRLSDFDNRGGWAATATASAKLADFANLNITGTRSTIGFGSIDQTVNERNKYAESAYGIQSNINLDKVLPSELGVKIPMFISFNENFKSPQFNPLDPDIEFKTALAQADSQEERDSLRFAGQEYEMRKSINFTNVRKEKGTGSRPVSGPMGPKGIETEEGNESGVGRPKSDFWANSPINISNFNTSYAYSESDKRNINIVKDHRIMHTASLNYNYQGSPMNYEPLGNWILSDQLALLRDFNFYLLPSKVGFRNELKRQVAEMQMRNTFDPTIALPVTYNKSLTLKRMYDVVYDLSTSLKLDYNATAMSRVDELPGNPKNQANRDTIWSGLTSMGRPTEFHQTLNLNWQIPFNKLPFMDFTSTSLRYSANYDWTTNSTAALNPKKNPDIYFGSQAQNSNSIQFNGNANFVNFYNQVPFLRKANQGVKPKPQVRRRTPEKEKKGGDESEEAQKEEKDPKILLGIARVSMLVRSASLTYSQTNGTLLPGVVTQPIYLGMDPSSLFAPGLGFVFGSQQDITRKAGDEGWLTKNPKQPNQFQKTFTENLNARVIVEPWKDIRIQLSATKVSGLNSSSVFRYHDPLQDTTLGLSEGFYHFNPMDMGNYSISFMPIHSAFEPIDSTSFSQVYSTFMAHRSVISQRLANQRAIDDPSYVPVFISPNQDTTGTRVGFDGYSYNNADVLIPAFLAAYSGTDPNEVVLNGRPNLPMPNWDINFNGLMSIPWVKKNFQSFTLTHSYKSLYTMNSYQSNMLLQQRIQNGEPANDIRNSNGDFLGPAIFPERALQVNQVSITENFGPFVGLNVRMKNQASLRMDVKRNRQLNLSLVNNQMTDTKGYEFVLGTGYIIKDVSFTVVSDGKRQKITSNLDLKLDFSYRDNATVIRRIQEGVDQVTAGQRIVSIKASADYMLSPKLTARIYYDQTSSSFKTSNAFPTLNLNAGLAFRFNLSQ